MKRPVSWLLFAVLAFGVGALIWILQGKQSAIPGTSLALERILMDDGAGFASVDGDRAFQFPTDHGAHPEFRSEVWYITGNLEDEEGRLFGFQLAFFRLRLVPEAIERESAWGANQVFRAHFALTDASQGRFASEERFSRTALGLSGMDESPVRVWLENWSLDSADNHAGQDRFLLRASSGGIDLELELVAAKPPVLPGSVDLFEPGPGRNAFNFYFLPRLVATGILRHAGAERKVVGNAWLDRAWGRVPSPRGQIALNRFALQLDDGRDLLCLQLRRRDGSGTPIPSCLLVGSDGTSKSFRRRDIRLEPLDHWVSTQDDTSYPLAWRLTLPGEGLVLELAPFLEGQELDFAARVWSGTVDVSGSDDGNSVSGRGHLELSGYADAAEGT